MAITENLVSKLNELKSKLQDSELASLFDEIDTEVELVEKKYGEVSFDNGYKNAQLKQQAGIIESLATDYTAVHVVTNDYKYVIPIKNQTLWPQAERPKTGPWFYNDRIKYFIDRYVVAEDREELYKTFIFENVKSTLEKQTVLQHHFRMLLDGKVHYYYAKATRVQGPNNSLDALLIGIICEDASKERETFRILSETDIMTGLYNRGTGEKLTRSMIESKTVGMFCMMDLNRFKTINDTLGHSIGDEVLIQFAKELKASFRRDDIVFRLGGDEFAVFAPGIESREIGERILKKFVHRLKAIDLPALGDISIETSIGAIITSPDSNSFESVYNSTDSCVYISKHGKDKGSALTFAPDTEYKNI